MLKMLALGCVPFISLLNLNMIYYIFRYDFQADDTRPAGQRPFPSLDDARGPRIHGPLAPPAGGQPRPPHSHRNVHGLKLAAVAAVE